MIHHPLVWLKRIRHRCGYGIHSPFAFDFVTGVIYETDAYYAYADIERRLCGNFWQRMVQRKHQRLLFRLANYDKGHPEDGMILVDDLQHNMKRWQQLQQRQDVRVTFDLYDIGIAFTNPRLNKQDYIINW